MRSLFLLCFFVFIGFLIFISVFSGAFLVDESKAVRALETQGYTNVEITSRDWFAVSVRGCAKEDVVKFNAEVTNPAGKRVKLFVCVGWPFKGATVRTN